MVYGRYIDAGVLFAYVFPVRRPCQFHPVPKLLRPRHAPTVLLLAALSWPACGETASGQAVHAEPARRTSLGWMTAGFMIVSFPVIASHRNNPDWRDPDHEFEDGFTQPPAWDKDDPVFDYVLHPLVGAEYYLVARNRGWDLWGSLAYSAALSAFYEYIPENMVQQPSAVDLLVTPLAGALLGEARYRLKEWIRRDPSRVAAPRFWISLLDPLDISLGGYPDGRARLYFNWKQAF